MSLKVFTREDVQDYAYSRCKGITCNQAKTISDSLIRVLTNALRKRQTLDLGELGQLVPYAQKIGYKQYDMNQLSRYSFRRFTGAPSISTGLMNKVDMVQGLYIYAMPILREEEAEDITNWFYEQLVNVVREEGRVEFRHFGAIRVEHRVGAVVNGSVNWNKVTLQFKLSKPLKRAFGCINH